MYWSLLLRWRAYSAWVIKIGLSSMDEIIAQQGKGPITDVSDLHGDFWPEEESIEDFLAAVHESRGHKRADTAA